MDCRRNRISYVTLLALGIAFIAAPIVARSSTAAVNESEPAPHAQRSPNEATLAKAYRFERGGWVYVHLEGSPHDIGYQHGYLLAPEISDAFAAVSVEMTHTSKRDWNFFRRAARLLNGRKSIRHAQIGTPSRESRRWNPAAHAARSRLRSRRQPWNLQQSARQ